MHGQASTDTNTVVVEVVTSSVSPANLCSGRGSAAAKHVAASAKDRTRAVTTELSQHINQELALHIMPQAELIKTPLKRSATSAS